MQYLLILHVLPHRNGPAVCPRRREWVDHYLGKPFVYFSSRVTTEQVLSLRGFVHDQHDADWCRLVQDMWPSDFYNGDVGDLKNPLRAIFNSTHTTRTYYENMSSAMAQLCGGFATVMTKDPNNIPLNGIWGRSELPTLKRNGNPGGQVHTVSELP